MCLHFKLQCCLLAHSRLAFLLWKASGIDFGFPVAGQQILDFWEVDMEARQSLSLLMLSSTEGWWEANSILPRA